MKYIVALLVLTAAFALSQTGHAARTIDPAKQPVTCSGDDSRPAAQYYMFGIRGPGGFCMTRIFYANTYGEARECALARCPTCRVEDITDKYLSGSPAAAGPTENYCPARR